MIPALTRPPIRHQAEQCQQVTGGYLWRGWRNRLTISKGNGRLDHDEAPRMTRICGKSHVLPELHPISRATRHPHIPSCIASIQLNDLETAVHLESADVPESVICPWR